MDNKPIFITILVIIIAALGITGFAAVSSFNATKKLTNSVNEIQNKQNEMEGKLGEIAGKIEDEEPETPKDNGGTKPEEPKNEDETKEWKTYRNEEQGFEIKYPEVSKNIDKHDYKEEKFVQFCNDFTCDFIIGIHPKASKETVKDVALKDLENHFGDLALETYKISDVIVNGKTGLRLSFQSDDAYVHDEVCSFAENNGKVFSICNGNLQNYRSDYDAKKFNDVLVSTFKFTK